jgi:lysophospholipase L1-like esterase
MAGQLFRSGPKPPRSGAARPARLILAGIGIPVLVFILLEGLLSTLLFSWEVLNEGHLRRLHVKYDAELGWVGKPDVHFPDMYGPGVYLRTNSQGFRGRRDLDEAVPPGKRRVICAGDSVTFGFGVADDHSWCRLLESLDGRLETVNMALPAYGVDQAYLWYKRDAARLQHHVNILAPITDDFTRMRLSRFRGYGKPVLAVEDGQLVVTNVPVSERRYHLLWLTDRLQHLRSLRLWEAVQRIRRRLAPTPRPEGMSPEGMSKEEQNRRTAQVIAKLLEDLKQVNVSRSSTLVVVYLPTLDSGPPETAFWVSVLDRECRALGIPFVNLAEAFDNFSYEEAVEFFLPGDLGHFSVKGNQYMAKLIYDRLRRIPEVSRIVFADDRR